MQTFLASPVDIISRVPKKIKKKKKKEKKKQTLCLFQVFKKQLEKNVHSAQNMLKEWANNRKDDLRDTLAYLLIWEWTQTKDDRLGPSLSILESEN